MKIIKEKGDWTFYEFWRESMKFHCIFKWRLLINPFKALQAYKRYRKAIKKDDRGNV